MRQSSIAPITGDHQNAVFGLELRVEFVASDPHERELPAATRLLTQVERVLKVNQAEIVSREIVTAGEGQACNRTRQIAVLSHLRQIALKRLRHFAT